MNIKLTDEAVNLLVYRILNLPTHFEPPSASEEAISLAQQYMNRGRLNRETLLQRWIDTSLGEIDKASTVSEAHSAYMGTSDVHPETQRKAWVKWAELSLREVQEAETVAAVIMAITRSPGIGSAARSEGDNKLNRLALKEATMAVSLLTIVIAMHASPLESEAYRLCESRIEEMRISKPETFEIQEREILTLAYENEKSH